ncbi:n-acetylglutamate synthase [Aggregatimonas sangjinii]|uniref:N-acetylglutamate synthase n=1 Tax=Aggregatimonas sangjinii TaxID=2583587 RepID=A0A5B7SXC5_9FLAO|nr:n-acetylglutamate synthase [Aggregatimonas sangjinii]QCX01404.1 n-acetylglutamate synthase [Aggregatimonas sangjinii]
MIDYDNKKFYPIESSENAEVDKDTIFHYRQEANVLTSEYSGGDIIKGHLIGLVDENGHIEMRYHQVNTKGALRTGICHSMPEVSADGKIRLHENWEWTSGDRSKGTSVLKEL